MRYILIIFFLPSFLSVNIPAHSQPTFFIEYRFRLFSENGNLLTCDSLKNDSLFVCPYPGSCEESEYDTITYYFYVKIHTSLPTFNFYWYRNSELMNITIDCPTDYKNVFIDTLFFKKGVYFITNFRVPDFGFYENDTTNHFVLKSESLSKSERTDILPECGKPGMMVNIYRCR